MPVERSGQRQVSNATVQRPPLPTASVDTWVRSTVSVAADSLPPLPTGGPLSGAPPIAPRVTPSAEPSAALPAVRLPLPIPAPEGLQDARVSIADALRRAVVNSGVFYEAHLADWVEGRRSLDEVKREALLVAAHAAARSQAGEPDPVQNQQVDFLRHGHVGWQLPPPWREGTGLWVAEETPDNWQEPAQSARIVMDIEIPGRGRIQVGLRLHGNDLLADVDSADGTRIDPADLLALGQRLGALPDTRLAALRNRS
jgi:hypothetical protein